jgi:hypothetical protein
LGWSGNMGPQTTPRPFVCRRRESGRSRPGSSGSRRRRGRFARRDCAREWKEMRSFTGSSDSIRHRAASGNSGGVMLLALWTDESTIHGRYRPGSVRGWDLPWTVYGPNDWQFNCLWKAAMICYAVRSSFGDQGSGRVEAWWQTGPRLGRKYPCRVGRSASHPRWTLFARRVRDQKSKSVVKTDVKT